MIEPGPTLRDAARALPSIRIEAGELAEAPIATPGSYGRIGTLEMNGGLPLLVIQEKVRQEHARLIGCFGSWRSGKTRAAGLKTIQIAAKNPWRATYRTDNPTSMVISETYSILRESTWREVMSLIPEELILRKWRTPGNMRIRLVNGHDITFRTWSGKNEGAGVCGVWLDEAHKLDGPQGPEAAWANFAARSSDPRARDKQIIVTGLPEYGWLSDLFDRDDTEDRVCYLCALSDNFYLAEDVIQTLRSATTAEEAEITIHGRWRKPSDVIYYAFETSNIVDHAGDVSAPCDLSIDLGDKGAMLVGQNIEITCFNEKRESYRSAGVLIVDEVLPNRMSVRDALSLFLKEKPWKIKTERSRIYVDPKADRDELAAISEILGVGKPGGPRLVRKRPKQQAYKVEYGHRCCNSAFRDMDQNRRLFISKHLPRTKRSLIPGLRRHRRKPSGQPYRDNICDHILDCLRYMVVDRLPLHSMRWRMGAG